MAYIRRTRQPAGRTAAKCGRSGVLAAVADIPPAWVLAAVALIVAMALTAGLVFQFSHRPEDLIVTGRHNVPLDRTTHQFYTDRASLLGEPLYAGMFEGRPHCTVWEYYATCSTKKDKKVRFEFLDLGRRSAVAHGVAPQPAQAAPALHAWIEGLAADGVDTDAFVGQVISDPICAIGVGGDPQNATCVQFTTRQEIRFRANETDPSRIHRRELGRAAIQ